MPAAAPSLFPGFSHALHADIACRVYVLIASDEDEFLRTLVVAFPQSSWIIAYIVETVLGFAIV